MNRYMYVYIFIYIHEFIYIYIYIYTIPSRGKHEVIAMSILCVYLCKYV